MVVIFESNVSLAVIAYIDGDGFAGSEKVLDLGGFGFFWAVVHVDDVSEGRVFLVASAY